MEQLDVKPPLVMTPPDDDVRLADVIRFVVQYWLVISIATIVPAVLTAVYFQMQPPKYEATATLVISPARATRNDGSARTALTAQAYQNLIESDAVLAEATKKLHTDKVLSSPWPPAFSTRTKLLSGAKAEDASVLEVAATYTERDEVAKITNVWVDAFIEYVRKMVAEKQSVAERVLEKQVKDARERVAKIESEKQAAEEKFRENFNGRIQALEEALSTARTTGEDALAAHSNETAKLLNELRAKNQRAAKTAELDALERVYAEVQGEHTRLAPQIETQRTLLDASRKQLAQTPPTVISRKAITDEAIWQALAQKGTPGLSPELIKQALISEEPNPLYAEIARRVALYEIDVNALTAREERLRKELARMSEQLAKTSAAVGQARTEEEQLETQREAGATKIKDTMELQVTALEKRRDAERKDMDRQRTSALATLERELSSQRDAYNQLLNAWGATQLGKSSENFDDLRLGAAAVVPSVPVSRKTTVFIVVAAIAGAMVGTLLALGHKFARDPSL